jgi:FecR protein
MSRRDQDHRDPRNGPDPRHARADGDAPGSRSHRDPLEQALAEVLAEPLDQRRLDAAAARVWERLSAAAVAPGAAAAVAAAAAAAAPDAAAAAAALAGSAPDASAGAFAAVPRGCEDFDPEIAAYLRGELAPARALLLADHTRECLPCRRALHAARQRRTGQVPAALHQVADLAAAPAAPAAPAELAEPAAKADPWRRGVAAEPRTAWRATPPGAAAAPARRLPERRPWLVAAALLAVGCGLGLVLWRALAPAAGSGLRMARVEAVDGSLYRIAGASSVAVAGGDAVVEGERVRTAKGSRAILRLTDGSRIEMAERAGLSLAAGRGGNTIALERGLIIVQAARQRPRHLYVATGDCLVSVTGTIFAVNHGTKGSRVSVVEGEVRVEQARRGFQPAAAASPDAASLAGPAVAVLHPGEQVTTHPSVAAVPVREEVAWSRDAARYDALLAALTAAGGDIDRQVTRPAQRTSSRLLDLVPDGSLVYVALPNLAASLQRTQELLEQRLAESPELAQWWSATLGSPQNEARFHELIREVGDVGRYLGDEVVVAAGSSAAAGPGAGAGGPTPGSASGTGCGAPVLLAEAAQEPQLRATLEQEVAAINQRQGKTALVLLDRLPPAGTPCGSPPAAPAAAPGSLLLWVGQGLLLASPSAAQIAAVAANLPAGAANPFVGSSFHARLVQAYADGAGWLFAVDLERLMASRRAAGSGTPRHGAAAMGLFDLQHFVLERHDAAASPAAAGAALATETRAALTFSQTRRGIASWLAAPAPMGSLGFFSADANLVAAFVVRSPVELLDELLSLSPELAAQLARAEAEHGFNLRDDLAAPLGGEIALGLDGPALPSPSWELVAEVYDPVRLQQTLARAVQQAAAKQAAEGRPGITLRQEKTGDRTYYTIASTQPPFELHYLFADGYLVAAPTRAQLDRALAQRAAGTTLAASSRLRGLLGRDGQVNVSALFYQNLGPVLTPLGAAARAMATSAVPAPAGARGRRGPLGAPGAPGAPAGRQPGFGSLLFGAAQGPSLLYAYAETDRIVFGGHSEAGPMGLNLETLAGFGGILGGVERAESMAHDRQQRRGGS